MLTIFTPEVEVFDESVMEFRVIKARALTFEHSLVSVSKWEALHGKVFLSKNPKTQEETMSYIKCMIVTPNVPDDVFFSLSSHNLQTINDYISSEQTATFIRSENNRPGSKEPVTSELIYYWMVTLNIPFECQKWHLNRLLTLIKVCNHKNAPKKKRGSRNILQDNAALNARRRKQMNTRG